MMDAESSAHNHKDFLNAFFQPDQPPSRRHSIPAADIYLSQESQQQSALMNPQQQGMPSPGVGMDVLEGLMGMQERGGQPGVPAGGQPTPQMLMEHQMRLNQLQQLYQLQTQIFQQQVRHSSFIGSECSCSASTADIPGMQPVLTLPMMQIELLSGQSGFGSLPLMLDRSRDPQSQQQQYLPTPAQSTELPPQPSPNFVPPMLLQSTEQNASNMPGQSQQNFLAQHVIPPAPHSAPANIVFQNIQSPYPLPSPADLDFDEMSPLTSPWLGAYNTNQSPTNNASRSIPQGTGRRASGRRL
ncbi:hypothetical protein NM688_g8793 [Phlebia brevispora]|uniref:Uncharacterized protein n=1 Tax=Phlebia brevispora TaxID=194682 RepID=A0ACC1RPS1_9APHY|nr:hypothetical protein NM688_g8793 [Phlebia brevispora]